jgi:mRNA interferase YafQ
VLDVRYSSRFKKDFKTCTKRGYDLQKLLTVINTLRIPSPLPDGSRDHQLTGDHKNYRECHISPDWLLIYCYDGDILVLYRTGTHADLFGM